MLLAEDHHPITAVLLTIDKVGTLIRPRAEQPMARINGGPPQLRESKGFRHLYYQLRIILTNAPLGRIRHIRVSDDKQTSHP